MITFKNVYKSFANLQDPILKDISFRINPGDFCCVLGNNGSGKSTLFKIIQGDLIPDQGVVERMFSLKKDMALVVQDISHGTVSELSLLENLVLSLSKGDGGSFRFYKKRTKEIEAIVNSLNLGLEGYLNTPLKFLSGGQRQMIATLKALMTRPKLLLLDEHTSALDPKIQDQIMAYTAKGIQEQGITAMMITHKLEDALIYGNRLLVLMGGRVILDVSGAEKTALTRDALREHFYKIESNFRQGDHQ